MCTASCLDFVRRNLRPDDVLGRAVLEVGALDVNGSVRPLVCALQPKSYVGVDLQPGPGVDEICDAAELVARFGANSFDLLISTELLEHVRDWRKVIGEFKKILKPGGRLLITTRSRGFPYHAFPNDFWRYEPSDFQVIFSDFECEVIESDPSAPGLFLKARKPKDFVMHTPESHALFSVITGGPALAVTESQIAAFRARGKRQQIIRVPERFVRRWLRKLRS
jgi:SAM-dependent methyltransferase